VVLFASLCVLLGRRWRGASPLQRRSLAPVLFAGLALANGSITALAA
jgi:hypothetical protein